jgi:Tol biopolymer transport system component/C-terminal processing protease CtpA/Prc
MATLRKLFPCILTLALVGMLAWLPGDVRAQGSRTAAPRAIPYFTEPAISPDGKEIAFVSSGDIWTVPAGGGEAQLLISHAATEGRPLYSPDGRRLAFTSTRTGNTDIFIYTFESGEVRRLTFDDASEQLDAWSRDARWIYFFSSSRDIAGMNDIYRVSVEGGTPMQVSADRYASEFFSAPSPDGSAVAFSARGNASGQWWRKGHSHLDESEIWLLRPDASGPPRYERLVEMGAKNLWPMWSADGRSVYYVSDRSGAQNIWVKRIAGEARQVTQFKDGRVLWPTISYDGRTIVFEHDFEIWKLDTSSGQASKVPITRRSAPPAPGVEHLALNNQFQELELSPDGKKVAIVVRGEVFAASAKDGGTAARVTQTASAEEQIAWAPDSKRLVYTSSRDGATHIFLYDFTTNTETRLTQSAQDDSVPVFSPDGKLLAFIRDGRELRVLDLATKEERVLATGGLERPPFQAARPFVWSPDSRWVAVLSIGEKSFTNVHVVPAAGGERKAVSFLANAFGNTVSWSPDGTYLLFDTGQRTETRQLARVDLIPRAPKFREDQFRDLFREEPARPAPQREQSRPQDAPPQAVETGPAPRAQAKKETKPVEIVFEGIRRRLSLLPVGVDLSYQVISPDGKWVLMVASVAGQQNLYVYSLDELAREPAVARQLTSTAGFKSNAGFTPDSKEVFFLQQGRIQVINVESRQTRALEVTAEMDVDFEREKMEVFQQAWSYQRDHFYDPNFHGVDWEAVRAAYAPRVAGARTPDELRRLLSLMVGELNASHLGVSAPPSGPQSPVGKLGLRFDRGEYERAGPDGVGAGKLRITEVIPLSPAALGEIKPGEYLVAVEGTAMTARTNLDELLLHKVGRRVVLNVAASADGANSREVVVQPISTGAEKNLLYRHWVETRRAYVERASNGRLGYVHMPDMSAGSLAQLYVDLDTENHAREGVVIDIRNNNGGFVNVYAIDVLARRGYLNMSVRGGFATAPARSVLGQRALEKPTILVVNQHSLSDAEDFTEGYRTLKLGKVVGEPTAGWIIYTSGVTLIDGSSFRIPFMKVTANDGTVMEMHPRPVDIPVQRLIGESYTDKDSQLDAAVAELLKQMGKR